MGSSKGAKTRLVDSARFINPKLWIITGCKRSRFVDKAVCKSWTCLRKSRKIYA